MTVTRLTTRPDPAEQLDREYQASARLIMSQPEIDQPGGHDRWLAERRHGSAEATGNPADNTWRLTASDLAAVVGLSSYGSPFSLYHEKLTGESTFEGSDRTDLGLYLEGLTAARFAATHPELELGAGGLYVSRQFPWLGATFDRIAYDIRWDCAGGCPGGADHLPGCTQDWSETYQPAAPVQLKSWAGDRSEFGPQHSSLMPVGYRVQCLVEMAVLGTDLVYLPVILLPDGKVLTLAIERDADADRDIAALIAAGEEFITHLDQEQPPEVDWSPTTAATLKKLHPSLTDREVHIPARLADQRVAAQAALQAAKRRCGLIDNQIRALMGDARAATSARRGGTDVTVVTRSVYPVREHVRRGGTVDRLNTGAWGK